MKVATFLAVFVALSFLFSAPALFAHEGHQAEHNHPYPTEPFDIDKGEALYKQYCASCHGINGDGQGPAASSLNPKPTNFLDMQYMVMRSRVDHYESIRDGRQDTAMPPWEGTLSDKDIWGVIAYLEHLFNHQSARDHHEDHHEDHNEKH